MCSGRVRTHSVSKRANIVPYNQLYDFYGYTYYSWHRHQSVESHSDHKLVKLTMPEWGQVPVSLQPPAGLPS
ncbi:hypothetical protein AERO9A_110012 [Aeromonas salmonicida]|nr:hypothetical protein AERO9A_110012 [Aeromonas salmonicida]